MVCASVAVGIQVVFPFADIDALSLHQPVLGVRGRFTDDPDFHTLLQIAVFESGAFVAPGLADFDRLDLTLSVHFQDTEGHAEFHRYNDACQFDIADGEPVAYSVRLGTVTQRHELAPKFEIWRQSALPWLPGN